MTNALLKLDWRQGMQTLKLPRRPWVSTPLHMKISNNAIFFRRSISLKDVPWFSWWIHLGCFMEPDQCLVTWWSITFAHQAFRDVLLKLVELPDSKPRKERRRQWASITAPTGVTKAVNLTPPSDTSEPIPASSTSLPAGLSPEFYPVPRNGTYAWPPHFDVKGLALQPHFALPQTVTFHTLSPFQPLRQFTLSSGMRQSHNGYQHRDLVHEAISDCSRSR